MNITINRGGTNYGPYSLDLVNSMLASGQLKATELAWAEGTPSWVELQAIPGVVQLPPWPAPTAAPAMAGVERDAGESERQILPAVLLAFFLGFLGIHRFYLGRTGSAIAQLVMTLSIVGALITLIWYWIDMVILVTGGFRDGDERIVKRWV